MQKISIAHAATIGALASASMSRARLATQTSNVAPADDPKSAEYSRQTRRFLARKGLHAPLKATYPLMPRGKSYPFSSTRQNRPF